MPEPFTVQTWLARDGTLHDNEAEALDHEARLRLIARTDAVLARIGVLKKPRQRPYDDDPGGYVAMLEKEDSHFNSGARAAIEAAIKAGLIKGEG